MDESKKRVCWGEVLRRMKRGREREREGGGGGGAASDQALNSSPC